jgi:hypothetical protein
MKKILVLLSLILTFGSAYAQQIESGNNENGCCDGSCIDANVPEPEGDIDPDKGEDASSEAGKGNIAD